MQTITLKSQFGTTREIQIPDGISVITDADIANYYDFSGQNGEKRSEECPLKYPIPCGDCSRLYAHLETCKGREKEILFTRDLLHLERAKELHPDVVINLLIDEGSFDLSV